MRRGRRFVYPIAFFLIAFASIFGGALLGMFFRTRLPEHHLNTDSRDVIKLGTGMIATLAALVLGLLISSAKGTFDAINNDLKQVGSKIILLDRTMAQYGPETREARDMLRRVVAATIARMWPTEKDRISVEKAGQSEIGQEDIDRMLRQLSPRNDQQRQLQAQALQISDEIAQARWLFIEYFGQSSFPLPILVLLVCWLTIIFFTFGLFASRNATVIVVLLICAFSAASSLLLILDLDQPFSGLIKISNTSLVNVLAHLGQ
jgi:hypothetical protein